MADKITRKDFINERPPKYDEFCKILKEGDILYNLDATNLWGEYLLVAAKAKVKEHGIDTWFILLLGMKKEDDKFVSAKTRISLTPDKAGYTPYLKYVGHCKYEISFNLGECVINQGLVVVYEDTDLWKYNRKINARKPRSRKYEADGTPTVRKTD